MADREKKRGKTKIEKFEYLENKKSFLDEERNIVYSFWRAIIWWKVKIWWKIADTSFKKLFVCCHPTKPTLEVLTKNILIKP